MRRNFDVRTRPRNYLVSKKKKNKQNVLLSPTSNVQPRVPLEIRDLSFTFRNFFARTRKLFGYHVIAINPASQPASQPAS